MTIQRRILFGYIILMAVIASMAAILLHERERIKEIETEAESIRHVRSNINVAQHHITLLATFGESVIGWEETDKTHYHALRLRTNSLLQTMKLYCTVYIRPAQIEILRNLLAEKENHLLHLTEIFAHWDEANSLLVNHLSEVARRATCIRTVRQKKSGVAGFFGGEKMCR